MRSLAARSGTIRITSLAGELRNVSVSGFAKVRLRWLFRNFGTLDFPVLNIKQQQLIAQVWHAAPSADSVDAPLDLIGTIEGFLPKLYQPPVPALYQPPAPALHQAPVPALHQPPAPALRLSRPRARVALPGGVRIAAIGTAMGVSLLGCLIYLGPKHQLMPQSRVIAVSTTNQVNSTARYMPPISTEPEPSAANLPEAAPKTATLPPVHPPPPISHEAVSLKAKLLQPEIAVSTKTPGKSEVMIRVSVDHEGQAQTFHILQGNRKKMSVALNAAKHWHFQPCSSSAGCEHLLKFTDYGDASILQMID